MRGITYSGNIVHVVTVKPNRPDDGCCVTCPFSSYTDYTIKEIYNKSYKLIQSFFTRETMKVGRSRHSGYYVMKWEPNNWAVPALSHTTMF